MTTALTVSKRELNHKKRENSADRNLAYFKSGMDAIKPILASKPFICIGGTILIYKLNGAGYVDDVTSGVLTGSLLAYLASDVVEALIPF